jgi:hypothetical protein
MIRPLNERAHIKVGCYYELSKTIRLVDEIATRFSELFVSGDPNKVTFTYIVPRRSVRR